MRPLQSPHLPSRKIRPSYSPDAASSYRFTPPTTSDLHGGAVRLVHIATVRLHKAALAAVHKAAGHEDPTDNEGVRRIIQGIARAHGKAQRQAKPLTAEALAAVKATAKSRRTLGDCKRQESAERAWPRTWSRVEWSFQH